MIYATELSESISLEDRNKDLIKSFIEGIFPHGLMGWFGLSFNLSIEK